jgi:hypothetical protein
MSNISPVEYNSQIVVTTQQIASEHSMQVKVVNQKFRRNKKHFVINQDYFELSKDMVTNCDHLSKMFYHESDILFLFTDSGYLKFVKTINDEKAWNIYNHLIESYFKIKRLNNAEKHFLAKTKENRKSLTGEWKEHEARNYKELTIKEYESLFNDNTKRKKDMSDKELSLLSAFEFLEQRKLENNLHIKGDKELKKSLEQTGTKINEIVNNETKERVKWE